MTQEDYPQQEDLLHQMMEVPMSASMAKMRTVSAHSFLGETLTTSKRKLALFANQHNRDVFFYKRMREHYVDFTASSETSDQKDRDCKRQPFDFCILLPSNPN